MLLTSPGQVPQFQAEMKSSGLAARELKPLHPDKLRTAIGRVLASAKPDRAALETFIAASPARACRRGRPRSSWRRIIR